MQPDLHAAPDRGTDAKLTQPLGGAVKFILVLAAGLLAVVLIFAIFGPIELGGLGSGPACSAVHLNGIAVTGPAVAYLRPGATASGGTVSLCASHPTTGQWVLVGLTWIPTVALYLAVILLLGQLLRVIRSTGPFAVIVARRLRFLGWFVLAGSLIAVVGQSAAQRRTGEPLSVRSRRDGRSLPMLGSLRCRPAAPRAAQLSQQSLTMRSAGRIFLHEQLDEVRHFRQPSVLRVAQITAIVPDGLQRVGLNRQQV